MSTEHLYIVTGASRGMGQAMAQQLLQPGHTLLCLSRQTSPSLAAQVQASGATLVQWQQDLADGVGASTCLAQWLGTQNGATFTSATLINNAGVIPRIGPLQVADAADLAHALRVGLESPLLLCAAFLNTTQGWPGQRRVLNISSGLGRRPMAAQAAYCAAKAGMDHFTRCLALEEAPKPNGAKVCSLAPGVIDTDMQVQLRGVDAAVFPDHGRFTQLHTMGQLSSPEDAARQVLAYLNRADFGTQPTADVRG